MVLVTEQEAKFEFKVRKGHIVYSEYLLGRRLLQDRPFKCYVVL